MILINQDGTALQTADKFEAFDSIVHSMPLRVLVADDKEVVRSPIVGILKRNPNVEIVGESINSAQTLELTAVLKPDVLLLDLLMPDEEAFTQEAIKLHRLHNAGCILAISVWNDRMRSDGQKILVRRRSLTRPTFTAT